ncbi:50S ribosomal protein L22 [Sodalis-like secondary symbiont of Drepanosiphum platanoidis]|uniref:50S ribosomal protein L22 n=1 Tax=Sodalis-like secondary symbiont of Drepanosiphum platanoidis TaxID=2994493 RepID=UPI003463A726
MDTISKYKYARSSPQKIRLVANLIRGKKALHGLEILNFINKKASYFLKKVLKSATSNAEYNNGINIKKLKIKKVFVDNGPSIKRTMPRAKGRADKLLKRTSHITIILSDH